jgi:hypothetical protein
MGDVFHPPVEVYRPDWNTVFDSFPNEARQSRKWPLDFAAENAANSFTHIFLLQRLAPFSGRDRVSVGSNQHNEGQYEASFVL